MTWARRYALRNVAYSVTKVASQYGAGTYGEGTYGQEASDTLSNVDYVLSPHPGRWPASNGWVFRQGDVGATFRAVVLGLDGEMNLTPVERATLVIERNATGQRLLRAFALDIDAGTNELSCEFEVGDLVVQGMYRAAVQLVFASGRCMTVTPDDGSSFMVRGAS
jgi:hypothetical protein